MTWEIISGFTVLIGAVISVMNIVVKVNRTLINLEAAVRSLTGYMKAQEKRNGHFYGRLNILDKRITLLENTRKKRAPGGDGSDVSSHGDSADALDSEGGY